MEDLTSMISMVSISTENIDMEIDDEIDDYYNSIKFETDSDIEDDEFDDFLEGIRMIAPVDFERFCMYKTLFKQNRSKNISMSSLIHSVVNTYKLDDFDVDPEDYYTVEFLLN